MIEFDFAEWESFDVRRITSPGNDISDNTLTCINERHLLTSFSFMLRLNYRLIMTMIIGLFYYGLYALA